MRPISELTFEHGACLLRMAFDANRYAVGSLTAGGWISAEMSEMESPLYYFTHFLPLSEIAQLQEAGK